MDHQQRPPGIDIVHLPPEYEGTKLGATRTVRDIFHSNEEINNYIKMKIKEEIEKKEKKLASIVKGILLRFVALLIFAPVIAYLEYLIYKHIFE